jgi:hypothetical protein
MKYFDKKNPIYYDIIRIVQSLRPKAEGIILTS